MFHVKVRGGYAQVSVPPMDGDFDLDVTGTVAVDASDEQQARELALKVLMGVEDSDDGAVLTGDSGDPIEFEIVSVELAPAEAAS